jgi:hypothetical protein
MSCSDFRWCLFQDEPASMTLNWCIVGDIECGSRWGVCLFAEIWSDEVSDRGVYLEAKLLRWGQYMAVIVRVERFIHGYSNVLNMGITKT